MLFAPPAARLSGRVLPLRAFISGGFARINPGAGIPSPIPHRRAKKIEATDGQESAMRNFWWDGVFGEGSEVLWFQFFSVYALSLGAGSGLLGTMASLTSLLAALALCPGAFLAERTGRSKLIVALTAGGANRLVFLALACLPFLLSGHSLLLGLLALACLKAFLHSLSIPAWHNCAAQAVPEDLRGRFFAFRNFARQGVGLAMVPAVGLIVGRMGEGTGWQAVWMLAFVLGLASTAFFVRIPLTGTTSASAEAATPTSKREPTNAMPGRVLNLIVMTSFFQLAVAMAGPFFTIYLVQQLGASPFWVGLTAAASPLAATVCQPLIGRLADRHDPFRLLVISNLMIPLIPIAWIFVTDPWQVVFINLGGGALWAASQLASFKLLLELAPEDRLARFSAFNQGGMFLAGFLGPLIGAALIPQIGLPAVFVLSAAGRWVATGALWALNGRKAEPAAAVRRYLRIPRPA